MQNYWDIEPLTFWQNLIFTKDAPDTMKGWSLRGHTKSEKTKAWFQMTMLSEGCATRQEAIDKAIAFTKLEMEKEVLNILEKQV